MIEHSGAEVAALGAAARRLADYKAESERDDELAVQLMLSSGIPEEIALALQSVSSTFRGWGGAVESPAARRRRDGRPRRPPSRGPLPSRPQPDGHGLLGRRAPDGVHRRPPPPPHLLEPDHLPPLDGSPGRTHSLVSYLDSLAKTRELPEGRSSSPAMASRSTTTGS